jgi:hypothetical protein
LAISAYARDPFPSELQTKLIPLFVHSPLFKEIVELKRAEGFKLALAFDYMSNHSPFEFQMYLFYEKDVLPVGMQFIRLDRTRHLEETLVCRAFVEYVSSQKTLQPSAEDFLTCKLVP